MFYILVLSSSIEQINKMSVGAFVSAEENIRMKISEIKILEEFKEGDDQKFEIFYAEFMNLAIKMTRRKSRSQTISTPVENKKLTSLEYLKDMSNYACLNESTIKSKIDAENEEDKMITRALIREKARIREKSRSHTIGNPVQSKTSFPYINKSKDNPGLNRSMMEQNLPSKEDHAITRKLTQNTRRSQTICDPVQPKYLDYLNRFPDYYDLNESVTEPKLLFDEDEAKTRKIIRDKPRFQTICSRTYIAGPIQNEISIKSKMEPDEDRMKMKKLFREKIQPQTTRPVQSKNFKPLPDYLKNIAERLSNKTPLESKNITEEKEFQMLQQNLQKRRLHTGIQLLKGLQK